MFCSRSWPFSLLPSCLPIEPPDNFQVTGNLNYYWSPNVGLSWGNGHECMLGHLECPQGHDLPTTLELPTLHSATLQY
jgi:hypothetical protein